ncbi:hypothetical protein [Demequina sp. NBRC 110056]|uniref:hypothetical protein n=1 Tax=Demequina sp. NBRC 110056 TaxID=1570345 RepID=UPI000A073486|nr:hypothetical protein [Demequina sp. NBRC 110056]
MKRAIAIAILAIAVAGCSADATRENGEATFWDDAPTRDGEVLKDSIDQAAAERDCKSLQKAFDLYADAALDQDLTLDDRTRDFTAEVLTYIHAALSDAGCYGG